MSSHPMLSNAMHARVQRKRIESRNDICAKAAAQPVITPILTQQALATAHNAVPTIRKPHHHAAHTGHHHVHHGTGNTLVIGGVDTNLLESVQKLFARRILH